MKKILIFIIAFIALEMNAQVTYNMVVNKENTPSEEFFINCLDSITYEKDDEGIDEQIIWIKNNHYSYPLSNIVNIEFSKSDVKYFIDSNSSNYHSAIITTYGDFGFLQRDTISKDGYIAVFGHKSEESYMCVKIDSLGLIRALSCENLNVSFYYNENTFNIALWDNDDYNLITNIPYEIISTNEDSYRLKDSYGWGHFLCLLSKIISIENLSVAENNKFRQLLIRLSNVNEKISIEQFESQLSRNVGPRRNQQVVDDILFIRDFFGDFSKGNYIKFIKDFEELLDRIERRVWYLWLDIQTLGAEEITPTSYKLSCRITGYNENHFKDFGGTNCGMKLYKTDDPDNSQYQEKGISHDGDYDFTFSGLELSTNYSYIPSVYLYWYETIGGVSDISISGLIGGSFPSGGVTTIRKRAGIIYGSEKSFSTPSPSASTGEVVEVTNKSAIVKCSYSNVEGLSCGVLVSNGGNTTKVSTSASEGERDISLSGLKPCTTYTYRAYVEDEGNTYYGENKTFTTNPPDISGTWSCKETHYDNAGNPKYTTYSVTLNENGSVKLSNYDNLVSGSWGISCGGGVHINVITLATQSFVGQLIWDGDVDDLENPTKITGVTYGDNWNTVVGSVRVGGYAFEMTR